MNCLYVDIHGSDTNPGTKVAPFASLNAALDAARKREGAVTITVGTGEYREKPVILDKRDNRLTLQADGKVVINGGISLSASDFEPLNEEERARLRGDAKTHTVKADLKRFGLTREDWGEMCAIGGFNTAGKYDGAVLAPMWCELFVNNARQTVARYPNDGYLFVTAAIREGEGRESLWSVEKHSPAEWAEMRNPKSDIFGIDPETARRAASWKTLNDVWMFGYPAYTWADTSSPIVRIDPERCEMETKYVSLYGIRADAPYYIYNVFEELDAPGEWYLDRETGILYLYPASDLSDSEINLSISGAPLITAKDVSDLTIRGFTFMGTRGNGLSLSGNNIIVERCEICNTALWGMDAAGSHITIRDCEIHHTGRGGVSITGGDRAELISSQNLVTNNHFHDNAEIYKTGSPSVQINGVGCVVSHNCIHDLVHQAILFGGNEHVIEYNEIFRVCKYADDAAAIYGGRDYSSCGNIIRYNYFHDIESEDKTGVGIFAVYCDDNHGGTTIFGNIMHRCQCALLLHGGHDMVFKNNLIIEKCEKSGKSINIVRYGYWKTLVKDGQDNQHWQALARVPWESQIWREKYPHIAEYLTWDPETEQNIPHYSDISNNLIVDHCKISINFNILEERLKSRFCNNLETDRAFAGILEGDKLDLSNIRASEIIPGFEDIPFGKMGIQNA